MNKILKLAIVLFLVCAVAAGALGFVNNLTAPIIEAQAQAKTAAAFATVMQADGYEEIEFDKEGFPTVVTIHRATNGAGHVVTSTFSGAQGNITLACGVDLRHQPLRDLRPGRQRGQHRRGRRQVPRPVRRPG